VPVNTIANRTLISDETNLKIRDKAPAAYLDDSEIFPSGATTALLGPHFIDDGVRSCMDEASEPLVIASGAALSPGEVADLSNKTAADIYDRFVRAREQVIVSEIRRVCGITPVAAAALPPPFEESDELASDLRTPDEHAADELLELAFD
jgi:hypothetical protein